MRDGVAIQTALPQKRTAKTHLDRLLRGYSVFAVGQVICNALCHATETAAFNTVFCVFSAALLLSLLYKRMSGSAYGLTGNSIEFEKKIAGRSVLKLEIPLKDILTVRPYYGGERLRTSYEQVLYMDDGLRPSASARLAFLAFVCVWA